MSGMFRPSSTASIPSTSILHVSVAHEAVKGVAVDCRFTISDAKRRIQKKLLLYNTDCADWGFYEYHGSQRTFAPNSTAVRELGETEVLQNVTKQWNGSMYKFVFRPRAGVPETTRQTRAATSGISLSSATPASAGTGNGEEEEYEKRLREQKARMNRLSVRLTNRKSQGINLSNQDKLREMKVEQMGKRLTLMHAELEAARKLSVQAEEFEKRKREEEELMRAKASQLESKYQSLGEETGGSGSNRASITPQMQKQLDDMKAKRALTEGRLAQIEEQMAAKRRQRREAAAAAQEKQVKLMEEKLRQLEAELERDDSGADISQNAMESEFLRMEEEQSRWEQQRQTDMKRQQLEFEKERKEREARLKLQQDEMAQKIAMVEKALSEQAKSREFKVMEFKQKKVSAMEDRLKQLEAQLASGDQELELEMKEAAQQLDLEKEKIRIAQKERDLLNREARLNELETKVDRISALESMMEKLKNMPMGMVDFRSGVQLKKEIEELQAKLMDPNTSEKDLEAANIALEKALDAYEKTPECAAEIAKQKEEWIKKNEPLNKAAFAKMSQVYTIASMKRDPSILDRVKKYPELSLIMMTSDAILRRHENDFRTFVLNGLSEEELRAIRSVLPKFRMEQKVQVQFISNLDQKIEDVASRPTAKPAVKKSGKKFVPKKVSAPAGGLFAELLAKKGGGGGGGSSSSSAATSSAPPLRSMKLPPPGPPSLSSMQLPPPGPPAAPAAAPASLAADKRDLVAAMDGLLNSVMSGDEDDMAAKTRRAVADLRKLVTTGKLVNAGEAGKLESMATLVVVGVKEAIKGKKASELEFMNAQSKLAQIIERVKTQGNRIS